MKNKLVVFAVLLAAFSAHAAHTIFIPIIIQRIDKGKPGDICVGDMAKVGDKSTNPAGDIITITALSGHSTRCNFEGTPVLAQAEFTQSATFSAQAGINLPDGYTTVPLTELDRFHGTLVRATNTASGVTVELYATKRDRMPSLDSTAEQIKAFRISTLKDPKPGATEALVINGIQARRFAVDGKLGGPFARRSTYLVTIMDGAQELVVVVVTTPTNGFEKERPTLEGFAGDIVGINDPSQARSVVKSAQAASEVR